MDNYDSGPITEHPVLSHDELLRARTALLAKEKPFSATRDDLHRTRRALPWERIDVAYLFDTPKGQRSLPDLFDGRRQLVVYHFMFAPEWTEGCPHCSFWADSIDSLGAHLHNRDTTFVAVSRAVGPARPAEHDVQRARPHRQGPRRGASAVVAGVGTVPR